jgi:alpha-glucosidase
LLSIHEAALTDFSSMALARTGENTLQAELFPWSDGVKVRGDLPLRSPWRTIQIAEQAGDLIESNLISQSQRAQPVEGYLAWIKPGKYVGIWWEMHLGQIHLARRSQTRRDHAERQTLHRFRRRARL